MSCTLRAGGNNFDVDSFLGSSIFTPCAVFRRGEPRAPASQPKGPILQHSGFNIGVSDAEFSDVEGQTRDAIIFMEAHEKELERLIAYPGVDGVEIDFAIEIKEVFGQSYSFPPNLLFMLGRLRIELVISCYPAAEEKPHPTAA